LLGIKKIFIWAFSHIVGYHAGHGGKGKSLSHIVTFGQAIKTIKTMSSAITQQSLGTGEEKCDSKIYARGSNPESRAAARKILDERMVEVLKLGGDIKGDIEIATTAADLLALPILCLYCKREGINSSNGTKAEIILRLLGKGWTIPSDEKLVVDWLELSDKFTDDSSAATSEEEPTRTQPIGTRAMARKATLAETPQGEANETKVRLTDASINEPNFYPDDEDEDHTHRSRRRYQSPPPSIPSTTSIPKLPF
jgi:hypothetical protein